MSDTNQPLQTSTPSNPNWIFIVISIVAILAIIYVSFQWNLKKFEELSKDSLGFFDKAYIENIELTKEGASAFLSKEQTSILLKKVSVLEQNKSHHLDLAKKLYKNNYALLTLFPFLSAIAAIFAFLILQRGWGASNVYLKTYFILFATIAALVKVYPEVYQQSESIDKNLDTYLGYKKIQKSIFNYALTAPIIEKDSLLFPQFLNRVNTEESTLLSISFDLKEKSVSKDIFELK